MSFSVPNVFVDGATADANTVNANFAAIAAYLNGLSIPSTPVSVPNGGTGAATAAGALTNLGLATGTIIPCSSTVSGSAISLTPGANSPTVATYQLGTTVAFMAPSAVTGPMTLRVGALAALTLYDTPGLSATAGILANQICVCTYSPALNAFVLVNTPPGTGAAYLQAANNLSDVASTAASLTNLGGAALSGFTAGQVFGTTGNQPLPGGLVLKWGTATAPSSGSHTSIVAVTFASAFPTSCYLALALPQLASNSGAGGFPSTIVQSVSQTGFTIGLDTLGYTTFNQTVPCLWFALGH